MIYCVEDDKNIRELELYALQANGYEVVGLECATELYQQLEQELPELILLDIMLPGENGIEILRKLKGDKATKRIPVIMVTAKGTEYDKVIGLDNGADDYIAKPFGMMEMMARVKAVLRRYNMSEDMEEMEYGNVKLELASRNVYADGQKVALTLKEYEILRQLLENKGKVLTRDELLNLVWGYNFDGETRTVDVHIRTLRQKLGENCDIIETIRGVGYRIGE